MPQATFPENQPQLDILGELAALLGAQGLSFWLRGGWALDFLLGEETRPHGDLDLVLWTEARVILRPLLNGAGFAFHDRGFLAQQDFRWEGVKVSAVFVEHQPNGDLTPQHCPHLVWLPGALGDERQLHGLTCRTLTS